MTAATDESVSEASYVWAFEGLPHTFSGLARGRKRSHKLWACPRSFTPDTIRAAFADQKRRMSGSRLIHKDSRDSQAWVISCELSCAGSGTSGHGRGGEMSRPGDETSSYSTHACCRYVSSRLGIGDAALLQSQIGRSNRTKDVRLRDSRRPAAYQARYTVQVFGKHVVAQVPAYMRELRGLAAYSWSGSHQAEARAFKGPGKC